MEQCIDYRTYTFAQALEMLASYGFTYQPAAAALPQFLSFVKS